MKPTHTKLGKILGRLETFEGAPKLPEDCNALLRAHLLLKQHGQEICKRTRPLCERCPISSDCAYFNAIQRGSSSLGRQSRKGPA